MDKMELSEVTSLMKYQHYAHLDEWEQSRLISLTIGQVNSKKRLKATDIIEFSWDRSKHDNKAVSNEEVARLREKAKSFASLL